MNPTATTLILADAHLRGPNDDNQRLMTRFLDEQHQYHPRLVLLGDFFEFLSGNNRRAKLAYQPLLEQLAHFDEVHYIEGNHDFDIAANFFEHPGLKIHTGETELQLGQLRCLLFHGDRSDPRDVGSWWLGALLHTRAIRFARDWLLPDAAIFRFALAFAQFSRRQTYFRSCAENACTLRQAHTRAEQSHVDLVLFAHTHQALLEQQAQTIIANPGQAVAQGSYLSLSEKHIELHRFPDGPLLQTLPLAGRAKPT